jgi:sec-independent protein translocase protein TatC
MSEGDPDDERDDEERHDQPPTDDESAGEDAEETTGDDPDDSDHADGPDGDEDSDAPSDDSPDGDNGEPGDEMQHHPGPWPGEEPDQPPATDGDESPEDAQSDDDTPEIDEPPTGTAQEATGEDAEPKGSQDVTISGGAAPPAPDEPEPVGTAGAPDDQEMPLTQHIEEMIRRLLAVIVVMALVSAVVFPFADRLINFLWYSFLPGQPVDCVQAANATSVSNATNGTAVSSDAACPRIYHPLSLVLARLKVASLSGFIIALPVFVYQTYLFMRPGLYPNERRYYLASVPTSLVLAGIGVLFAYLAVLPLIFTYFLGYSQPVAEVAFGLSETFGLILLMLGMFAAIFQIPLFLMLAIMMGVTTRRWLQDRRLYFWFGFAGVAFLFSPDPTGMAPFIVALTMIVLFEGTLLLLRWTGR